MFCTRCGQQNKDDAAFCINCGNSLTHAAAPAPQATYTPQQSQYILPQQGAAVSPVQSGPSVPPSKTVKKSRKGLVIALIIGGIVLIAAAVIFIVSLGSLMTGKTSDEGTSVVGLWSSEERAEVLKFKENGSVYLYSLEDDLKGEYEYDKKKSEGVITLEDSDYDFVVDNGEIDVDDMGIYSKEKDGFDIDKFIEDAAAESAVPETTLMTTAETTAETTAVPTPIPTPTPTTAVETVTDITMPLTFAFGDYTGTYTGEVVDGLPNGSGSYMGTDSDGGAWVYEGEWIDGHFSGQGTTTWEDGYMETGLYQDDYLNGEGQDYLYGMLRYEGGHTNGCQNGQGTLYNHHGETIFTGSFNYGYIQESAEARSARVGAFKDQSVPVTWAELYQACETETSVRAQITGTVFDIYVYDVEDQYYCDFLMYEQGVEDAGRIVQVYYRLTEGEPMVTDGQTITVWGTTEYLYSYTSNNDEYLTVPLIEAWSVE